MPGVRLAFNTVLCEGVEALTVLSANFRFILLYVDPAGTAEVRSLCGPVTGLTGMRS